VSTRNHIRKLVEDLKQELSRRERESSSRKGTEQREAPGDRPGPSSWKIAGGIGAAVGLVAGAPLTVAAGVVAAGVGAASVIAGDALLGAVSVAPAGGTRVVAGGEETIRERLNRQKIVGVLIRAIGEDNLACLELYLSLSRLENCVADFAVFCRDYIDSVLSSELVEDEFRFLLSILRGTHSPGASANTRVSLPTLLDEEMNILAKRVSTLLEQLKQSATNQKALSITEEILNELREGPNDEEIRTMITNFIEAKFTEACKS